MDYKNFNRIIFPLILVLGVFGFVVFFLWASLTDDGSAYYERRGKEIQFDSWNRRCELDGGIVKWVGKNQFECFRDGEIINHIEE